MPDERYDAKRETVGTLLSLTSPMITVPEWQRSYSWETSQVETFWDDLLAFSGRYPDDNIVGQEYFLGSIVLVLGGRTHLLLDGQQRLATATILLSVLREARDSYSRDSATRLQTKYIADFDDATEQVSYKLTLNRYDWEFFRAEIQDRRDPEGPAPAATLKSHGLIRKAREWLQAKVEEESARFGTPHEAHQWVLRVGQVLVDHISVVSVSSTDEDNAAAVFETLNDRGIGLSTPDLLRNLLLRRAPNSDARERIVQAWQEVLKIDEEASVDDFIRHWWVSHRGDVKARKLYREIKATILAEDVESLQLSLDLASAAPLYREIVVGRDDDAEQQRLLGSVRLLGARPLYPALLSAYAAADGEVDKLRTVTRALITMFVRSSVIGSREAGQIETTVFTVAKELRDSGDVDQAVASLQAFAPSPEEFLERFRRATVSRQATARYLLREIEDLERATGELAVEGPDRVHLEHIYPQTPPIEARWTNHAAVINRVGNLTLLDKRLNTSVKNAGFDVKKQEAYETSELLITKKLATLDSWDEAAVNVRQDELAGWAGQIWLFPGEEAPTLDIESPAGEHSDPDGLPEVPSGD